ncbi:MAG: 3-phosphoshikimate 1-carboxyvinyltransferase [Verrucomicrobiales bacterium]|nr:3-phosphoshikimate 1-carboxyvinyltransferase [Verrucomicrobiales bacterium]
MQNFKVKRAKAFSAELEVPGDKSISHRSVMLASLTNGSCEITGFLPSEDCLATVGAMRALGVKIEVLEENDYGPVRLLVHGTGGQFSKPEQPIDCGNSGTTMRLLSGILATQDFETQLIGDDSLSKRPMGRIIDPLTLMGATLQGTGEKQTAPLSITGSNELQAIDYQMPVASAQVKSTILLAGMSAQGETVVHESAPTRDHTERMLNYLKVETLRDGDAVSICSGQAAEARNLLVPGDISSAAFWMVAVAATPGAVLRIKNVGLNSTRTGVLNILERMGASITVVVDDSGAEPCGTVEIHGGNLNATEIGGSEIPNVIDEIPILAVAAALAKGRTVIKDAGELRVKESDRLSAVADGLRSMGVPVQEFEEGMEIEGGAALHGAEIDSQGDHRIAMAFAIAGLFADGETLVTDVDCVNTSYPGFDKELRQVMEG